MTRILGSSRSAIVASHRVRRQPWLTPFSTGSSTMLTDYNSGDSLRKQNRPKTVAASPDATGYGEITPDQRALRHPGRHQSERPADFDRNRWPTSIGMPGRHRRNPQRGRRRQCSPHGYPRQGRQGKRFTACRVAPKLKLHAAAGRLPTSGCCTAPTSSAKPLALAPFNVAISSTS